MALDVWIPAILLGAFALAMRGMSGTWLAPAAFYPGVWAGVVATSLLVPQYPAGPRAVWWILLCIAAFSVAALIGRRVGAAPTDEPGVKALREEGLPRMRPLIVITTMIAVIYLLIFGETVRAFGDRPPLIAQLLLWSMYFGPVLGGILFATERRRPSTKWFALLSILPTLLYAIAGTGRTVMVFAFLFLFAGYYAIRIAQTGGTIRVFRPRTVLAGSALVAIVIVLGISISVFRGVYDPSQDLVSRASTFSQAFEEGAWETGWQAIRPGLFGNVYAFSYFFENALVDPPEPAHGARIFGGFVEFFGIQDRGTYENFEIEPGVYSNIYSEFMPPIMDFGFTGAVVSFAVVGLITGWAYARLLAGRLWTAPVMIVFYPHVLIQGGLFFAYNSLTMMYAMLATYLLFCQLHLHVRGQLKPRKRSRILRGVLRI